MLKLKCSELLKIQTNEEIINKINQNNNKSHKKRREIRKNNISDKKSENKVENIHKILNNFYKNLNIMNIQLKNENNSNKISRNKKSEKKTADSNKIITSKSILNEIEKLKKNQFNKNPNNSTNIKNDKLSLLKIKSFNDLNINLEAFKKEKTFAQDSNKKIKNDDINNIIENFKNKQNAQINSINNKF